MKIMKKNLRVNYKKHTTQIERIRKKNLEIGHVL